MFADLDQASEEAANAAFWHNLEPVDTAAGDAGGELDGRSLCTSTRQTSEASATASDPERGKRASEAKDRLSVKRLKWDADAQQIAEIEDWQTACLRHREPDR